MNFQSCVDKFTFGKNMIHIPIDSIDGVKVSVYIVPPGKCEEGCTCKKPLMYLLVDYYNSSRDERFPINNQEEFDIIVAKITCWEFDKFSNQFVDGSEPVADPEFYSCFESPKIKFDYDDCCVCLEKTRGTTKCNHHICLACFTNLKKLQCPLCRADICDVDSDDDDDE